MNGEKTPGLLAHVRVLDFTQFLAGPFGTQILGDLGAEIIKIEPFEGDSSRKVPPNFIAGSSTYYLSINRNKHSVVIDLRNPLGRDLAVQLVLQSDVLVENFRPGVMKRLGLDYETLSAAHPTLVYCAISGFGQDGPDRDRPAYDMIVQALSGGMSLTGEPEGHAVRAGVPIGDLTAGMYSAIGVLAALERRHVTGHGQYIDVSMLDGQVSLLCYQAASYLASGRVPGRQGRGHDSIPTYRCFSARDGIDVVITANTEKMWQSLCEVLELRELLEDERYHTNTHRHRNRDTLLPILEAAFRKRDASDWADRLRAAGVPVGTVNTLDRALSDQQVLYRSMVLDLVGKEEGQRARVVGNPIKMSDSPGTEHRYPPCLGADTRRVLSKVLSLSDAEINELLRAGVIGEAQMAENSGGAGPVQVKGR